MNTDNLKEKAAKAVNSDDSLQRFLRESVAGNYPQKGGSWPEAFEEVKASTALGLNDDQLISWLYSRPKSNALLSSLFGASDVKTAQSNFTAARRHAFYVFVQPLSLQTLDRTSYPGTYRYRDVAELFSQNKTALDPEALSRRVQATAQMLMRLVYGNTSFLSLTPLATRSIASAHVLGSLHNKRVAPKYKEGTRLLYNQGATAWTLLTFSYFVAEAWLNTANSTLGGSWSYAFDEVAWYRFWAIAGSAMGIDQDLIPLNHAEAKTLHDAFIDEDLAIPQGYIFGDKEEIFQTYNSKALPTRSEYLGLLAWLPSYLLLQVPRMQNWVPFVTLGAIKASSKLAGYIGSSVYSRFSKKKEQ